MRRARAPEARDARAAAGRCRRARRLGRAGARHRCRGVRRASPRPGRGFRGADRLYGFARHSWRRRSWRPRAGCGGATLSRPARWRSTPNATAPAPGRASARPISSTCQPIRCSTSCRRGWVGRSGSVELPAGRYETIMPPSTVADMMIYLAWTMDGRGAQEGRTALSAPGGGTRVGEKLTDLPLTLYSDPAAPGLECTPFVAASELVGDGVGVRQRHGHRPGGLDPRRRDQRAGLSAGRGGRVRRAGRGGRRQPADDRRLGRAGRHDRRAPSAGCC